MRRGGGRIWRRAEGRVDGRELKGRIQKNPEDTAKLWNKTCVNADDPAIACIGLRKDGLERLTVQQLDINSIADRTRGLSPLDVEALDKYYQGVPF